MTQAPAPAATTCPRTDRDAARSVETDPARKWMQPGIPAPSPSTYRPIPASEAPANTGARSRVGVPQTLCRCPVPTTTIRIT
jgi:hypothetical protein